MKNKPQTTKETQTRAPKKPLKSSKSTGEVKKKDAPKKEARDVAEADIINLILEDHKPLKKLIEILKSPEGERSAMQSSLEDFVLHLTSHAKAEEQSLYTQMKTVKKLRVESFEGDTEHALADLLVQEINATPDDDEWMAKVKVLAELVEHHIEEEESEILPHVAKDIDSQLRAKLGARYLTLKTEIEKLSMNSSTRTKGQAQRATN